MNFIFFFVFLIISLHLIQATDYPNMFEISTRPWLYSLSQKYGRSITKLTEIPDAEFENLANQGIDLVWMMGVWQLGAYGLNYDRTDPDLLNYYSQVLPGYTQDDIIGSPYAVVDYTCNSEIGTDDDLKWLHSKLNSLGMKLMLDFVPNHSAVDCPWTSSNMDYYIRAPKGTEPPYDPSKYLSNGIAYGGDMYDGSWKDTAQLNYWNMDLKAQRIAQMKHIASLSDGMRCDMAMLILNDIIEQAWGTQLSSWGYSRPSTEFWADAISEVKQSYPNTIFLAEVYWGKEPDLISMGFDYVYDKTLLDNLASYNLANIWGYLQNMPYDISHAANFIENHDEPRAVARFGSWQKADAAALVALTLPGMKFSFMGQWDGYHNKLDIHLRRAESESAVADVQSFYSKFIPMISEDVFLKGTYSLITGCDNKNQLLTWKYYHENQDGTYDKRLCVINFTGSTAYGHVVVSDAYGKDGSDNIDITELFTGTVYQRSASQMRSEGLTVIIDPWFAQIFSY
ncbi:alpha-14-glucan:maltose-1-phosphate maltosyltransferase [Anaeramoeba ignava]|uniref:Alpha-14-glucan:maltose-1-phosphate maltosyltransferase n=1 Tax=Anaeramoeba ignava TaxID=1746090 RepID=A0A9Q0LTL7_ANAIG|nr:alpha-14-glucan:maltose-1-phosphate maltosyltransferase [Anaeramoeba ignava]